MYLQFYNELRKESLEQQLLRSQRRRGRHVLQVPVPRGVLKGCLMAAAAERQSAAPSPFGFHRSELVAEEGGGCACECSGISYCTCKETTK